MTELIKNNMAIVVIFGQILVVALLVIYLLKNKLPKIFALAEQHSLLLGFLFSSFAMCGSLFYSAVLGYTPCQLCWWQRIFMYPLVFIFFVAMLKKDTKIYLYALPLAIIGGLVSLNHYILQLTGTSILPCSAIGQSVSCNKVFVLKFGYITIPLMALTAFLGVILSMLYLRSRAKKDALGNFHE